MIKPLLFLIIIVAGSSLSAQTKYTTPSEEFVEFHTMIGSAERMYKNDSLLQAYAKYDIAFSGYNGAVNPSHYFKAALCALKIKEEFKALSYLEKAITNGYNVDSAKKASVVFYNQNTKKDYAANISKWEAERDAERNSEWEGQLYATVEASKKFNGSAYKTATDYCVACMKNPKCNKALPEYLSKYRLVKEKMKADSVTAAALLANIQKNGFPNMKIVNKGACEIARTILLNYDLDKKNERLNDLLFKALINGQISPSFYAQVVDRRNVYNGLAPEFYEPVLGYEKLTAKDFAPANEKRKEIGLYNVSVPKVADLKGLKLTDAKAIAKLYGSLYDY